MERSERQNVRDYSSADRKERKERKELAERLLAVMDRLGQIAVAFSGGVDSCVLARAAVESAQKNGWPTFAVTAESPSMPREDLEVIRKNAHEIGISHQFVRTEELVLAEYRANGTDRCFHCKRHILERLKETARNAGFTLLAEGSNADDLHDFRPGFRAVQEHGVRSPLCDAGLTKENVRELARFWNLSAAEKPSTPCLATRIAYGLEITQERLAQIEFAENWLAEKGVSPLRVRLHENGLARIETTAEWFSFLTQPELREEMLAEFRKAGFTWVSLDLAGFQSGSLLQAVRGEPKV